MQSIDSMETYTYRTKTYLIHKKEETACNNIMKPCKNN